MLNISASLIKDYIDCKRKSYYRINKSEQAIQTDDMMVGEVVHKTLQFTWNKTIEESLEFANNLVKTYNIVDPNFIRMSKIENSIINYYNNWRFFLNDDDVIEKYFKVKFSNDINIVGKMDRITKGGIIIDWKTGSLNKKTLKNDIQSIIYYKSYEQLFGKLPTGVYVIKLNSPKDSFLVFEPSEFYIDNLYQSIIPEIVHDIKNGNFSRTGLYNNRCYNCQFQAICWSDS